MPPQRKRRCFFGCCFSEHAPDGFRYTPYESKGLRWRAKTETEIFVNWRQSFVFLPDRQLTFNSFIGPTATITVELPSKEGLLRPTRLSEADTDINLQFRIPESCRMAEQVERVLRGLKPMTSIVLSSIHGEQVNEDVLVDLAKTLGLGCTVLTNRWRIRGAILYRRDVTLADFFDADDVVTRYAAIGIRVDPNALRCPLEEHVVKLANEKFVRSPGLSYPMIGLCYGYTVEDTLEWCCRLLQDL